MLDVQPAEVREVLLSTSILELVSADAAVDLTGDEQAAGILMGLVRTNGFVQPIGSGWYRYHTLFAEMLRLKLRQEYPDRVAALHQGAARWYERNGLLTNAVRHAVDGDWQLAADVVIDQLAIGQIIEPRGDQRLAEEFTGMPLGQAWTGPQPHWSRRRLRSPLGGLNHVPPRWMPPMAHWSVALLIGKPRAGWPPRLSGSPPPCAPGTDGQRRRPSAMRS